jgi:site-specific recombinase XerD
MATAKVYFPIKQTSKKTGECAIYIRITHNRSQKDIKIGTSKPENWDFKNNLPSKKNPYYKELMVLIQRKLYETNKSLLELDTEEEDYSIDNINQKFKRRVGARVNYVLKYFDHLIDRFNNSNRIGYANIFKSTRNRLEEFNDDKDFAFKSVNHNFILRFEEFNLKRGVKPNAYFVYLRTFRTLINYAIKEGVVEQKYDPFKDFSFAKFRKIKTVKRTLSTSEIAKIKELKFETDSSLFHAHNYFIFSYYCRGINFIDMAKLRWNNIQGNRLLYIRSKSKTPFSIELLDPVLNILSYYKENYFQGAESYIFPILNESYETAKSIDTRIDTVLKQVNKNLKKIAEKAEINKNITTYVARHTFGNVLKRSGATTAEISEMYGHDKEETTQIYLDSMENSELDQLAKSKL